MERTDEQLAEMLRQEIGEIVDEVKAAGIDYRLFFERSNRLSGMRTVACWSYGTESRSYEAVNEGVRKLAEVMKSWTSKTIL